VLEDGGQATELDQVQFGELGDALLTEFGQMQSHHPGVLGVADAVDEACAFDAIDEPDHAVVAGVEVARGLADRRAFGLVVALHGEQQLVLGVGEPDVLRLFAAPAVKAAQGRENLTIALGLLGFVVAMALVLAELPAVITQSRRLSTVAAEAPSSSTLRDATCCVCQRKGCDSDAGNRVTHLSR
jgi:hypothetical protein